MPLTDLEIQILETADLLAQRKVPRAITYTRFHWSPVRFTYLLNGLIARPDVEPDPRWTLLVHRLRKANEDAVEERASRGFRASA